MSPPHGPYRSLARRGVGCAPARNEPGCDWGYGVARPGRAAQGGTSVSWAARPHRNEPGCDRARGVARTGGDTTMGRFSRCRLRARTATSQAAIGPMGLRALVALRRGGASVSWAARPHRDEAGCDRGHGVARTARSARRCRLRLRRDSGRSGCTH